MTSNLFYIDRSKNIKISYEDLFNDIKKIKRFSNFCQFEDFYEIFKHIIISILLDKEIVLVDSDFSEEERNGLLSSLLEKSCTFNGFKNIDFDTISEKVRTNNNWKLTLFTSGTTGKPKSISHTHKTLIDNIKVSPLKANDIWGFAYSPTHMAGVQVFFQALLNGNTIVKLFNHSKAQIIGSIQKDAISHISATPTFYRLLLPINEVLKNVKRVTFGGEKLSNTLKEKLIDVFPNAKFLNIYASTEAGAIFAASGETFKIKPQMQEFVKVQDDVLFIHKSKVGISDRVHLEGDWYNTGDLVKVISEQPLMVDFISRKNEMLNVGGFKVNPHEVEDVISSSFPEIKDIRVYGRSNSVLGTMVCSEIVLHEKDTLTKAEILNVLREKLQSFKIPRIIKFVERLEKTQTGKIKRVL